MARNVYEIFPEVPRPIERPYIPSGKPDVELCWFGLYGPQGWLEEYGVYAGTFDFFFLPTRPSQPNVGLQEILKKLDSPDLVPGTVPARLLKASKGFRNLMLLVSAYEKGAAGPSGDVYRTKLETLRLDVLSRTLAARQSLIRESIRLHREGT